ncbi:MAG: glycosyltransferase [Clostridia bacterium]|nr:glycosyltransferase [Clostridia bacterium]
MKVLIINEVCGIGSTGRIVESIANDFIKEGHEVKIAYGRYGHTSESSKSIAVRIGKDLDVKFHALMTRLTDKHGFYSRRATKKFLKFASEYNPDLVWMHNIHGYFINVEMLFDWIKSRPDMQVKWTLHDCWSFTGHCVHFTYAKCNKWKTGCYSCPEKNRYPKALLSNAKRNYIRKKRAFTGVKNMTMIASCNWIKEKLQESFLKEYPIVMEYNNIDLSDFYPMESDFRKIYQLEDKKLVLAVASSWTDRKGLLDLNEIVIKLPPDYKVCVVGVTEQQIKNLDGRILAITKTNSKRQLAEIYSTADVFINPTYEDTYPTVNLEARRCGTPVITYRTGGSVESVREDLIVEVGDIDGLVQKIITVAQDKTKFL